MENWKNFKREHYGKDTIAEFGGGVIDFSPDRMKLVTNGAFKNYDEYLEVQMQSCGKSRRYFQLCFYHAVDFSFKGKIDRFDRKKEKVLFRRIMISGMYGDGIGFRGKEDHVWMDMQPFAEYETGVCLSFEAEVYRYMKQSNGKMIDFGLSAPYEIRKIDSYEVPTDEQLIDQQINQLVCETCRYYDQCFMGNCIANVKERKERFETLKNLEPGKFTPLTVMLAYELEYRMMMQSGGFRLEEDDPNYETVKKIIKICQEHPVYYYGNVEEAFAKMLYPEKPRLYIE